MSTVTHTKSTTVRKSTGLALLRLGNRMGGQLAPRMTARRAAQLLCTPFPEGRRRAHEADDWGATHESLLVDGQRVALYHWGEAGRPRVLLAHGWSSHALRFLPWVQALCEAGYAVTAFDQPGHGRSEGKQCSLACFVSTLQTVAQRHGPFAAVIGHSMGGTAVTLALANAQLVAARVILIAPATDPGAATLRFTRLVGLTESMVARIHAVLEAQTGTTVDELSAATRARTLGLPALVMHDLDDREVPWAEGESCARQWPGARLLSTSGLGHSRIVNDADTLDAGLRFVRGETVGERVVSSPNLPYGLA